ncbi:YwmB family TATA-box binding protein [Siminovitchia fortis]|uniref:Uncharacterized protein n=1 Tax=Siminovitchia fortis TaxID=254758 RepID=A0A443IZC2_9BACI|nr:YwmB family TATA-box binding protein [Siminovitchia fortis]RWR13483.1 hypothetical protein D4N35_004600 [Siminovitchia fortis]WHY81720.1 YwmB family TATA-box binding protein [Siminovitchia fortis]
MKEYCRKHFISFMFLTCLIAVFIGNNTSVAGKSEPDIEKLAQAVQKQHGTVIEWSLHTRELAQQPSQDWSVTRLKKTFPEWNWSLSHTDGNETVAGVKRHGNIEEIIKAVTADNTDNSVSYVAYEIKGSKWNKGMLKRAEKLFHSRTELIFKRKPVVFSCIKGIFNDHEGLEQSLVNGLLTSLQAKEKEALREEDFLSISAYSSLFSQSLSLPGEEMNLQIGLRKNDAGHGTYFTVGTPILTNEY